MGTHRSYYCQQGSNESVRTASDSRWYVIWENWEGSKMLNSGIYGSYATEDEAARACRQLNGE